jgi:hypothetical protein
MEHIPDSLEARMKKVIRTSGKLLNGVHSRIGQDWFLSIFLPGGLMRAQEKKTIASLPVL